MALSRYLVFWWLQAFGSWQLTATLLLAKWSCCPLWSRISEAFHDMKPVLPASYKVMYTYILYYTYTCKYSHIYTCVYMYLYDYMYICLCRYAYICVRVCVHLDVNFFWAGMMTTELRFLAEAQSSGGHLPLTNLIRGPDLLLSLLRHPAWELQGRPVTLELEIAHSRPICILEATEADLVYLHAGARAQCQNH